MRENPTYLTYEKANRERLTKLFVNRKAYSREDLLDLEKAKEIFC